MSKEPSKEAIRWANEICNVLMDLSAKYPERWDPIENLSGQPYPFADLAYGEALADWHAHGNPKDAWFSAAPGQEEDPYLLEFKAELTAHFGLPIYGCKEGMERERLFAGRVMRIKTTDWGPN